MGQLAHNDPELGFSGLPEPVRSSAHELSSYYNMIGYLVMLRVVDQRVAIPPLYFRATKTWEAVRPYIYGERALRGDHHSFMNGYEALIQRIATADIEKMIRGE